MHAKTMASPSDAPVAGPGGDEDVQLLPGPPSKLPRINWKDKDLMEALVAEVDIHLPWEKGTPWGCGGGMGGAPGACDVAWSGGRS